MKLKSKTSYNQEEFLRLKKRIQGLSEANRNRNYNPRYAASIPLELDFQLTYSCNLRCTSCYQWNSRGHFHQLPKNSIHELPVSLIEEVISDTKPNRSDVFLWGGEPLLHTQWDKIAELFISDPRWTVLCTNGLLLHRHLDSLLAISSTLAILVSVDGLKTGHDEVRGEGTFESLMSNINKFLGLKKKGIFRGKISVSCLINNANVSTLYDFLRFFESVKVDTVYFNYPWYISNEAILMMDNFVKEHFPWISIDRDGKRPSWHSYSYHLSDEFIVILREQISKIQTQNWNVRVRFQPALDDHEIPAFIGGTVDCPQGRHACLAISNRMEIHADGSVSACKFFPEFAVGNLKHEKLKQIWHNEHFGKIRETIAKGLMPVCSKCVLLYSNGI